MMLQILVCLCVLYVGGCLGQVSACDSGSFFNLNTSQCRECPLDFYQDQRNATGDSVESGCLACPNNTFTATSATKTVFDCMEICGKGRFFETLRRRCQVCPKNTFQSGEKGFGVNATKGCVPCPPNTVAPTEGSSSCVCRAGTYLRQGSCLLCPRNQYQDRAGSTSCLSCPQGHFTYSTGAASRGNCVPCSPGQYLPWGSVSCQECPRDYYQEHSGQTSCTRCPSGKKTERTGSRSRSDCKSCFHGDGVVRLADGREITLDRLRVGDEVLAVRDDGKAVYSRVLLMLHRDPRMEAEYIRIYTEASSRPLTLTPDHLTFSFDTASGVWQSLFAADVTKGMLVGVMTSSNNTIHPSRVTHTSREILTSSYAPLTEEGTIVVDDVMASCYAAHHNHNEAHAAMTPVRAGYKLGAWLGLTNPEAESKLEGIHWSARLMMKITCALSYDNMC